VSKIALILTLVDQDFLTTDFHSSKSSFFLVSSHPVKNRSSSSFLAFSKIKVQLGPKMAIFLLGRGQTLTKFKNILHGVYWDQYQGFKTPAFWLNVFFQKAAPPY
jgi:hypothetical protein